MTAHYVTPPNPLTIAATIRDAAPGDVIHLAPGSYPEDLYVTKRLVIMGEPGVRVRSVHFAGVTGGSISGVEAVGLKVPLPTPIEATKPDDPSIPPIKGTLSQAERLALAAKKWAAVLAAMLHFDGLGQSAYTIGIKLSECSGVKVSGCSASRHTAGISVEGSKDCVVTESRASICRVGLRASKSARVVFDGCKGSQNLGSGFELAASVDCVIERCLGIYNGLHNYILHEKAAGNVLRNCSGSSSGHFSEVMPWPGSSSFNAFDVGAGNVFEKCLAEWQRDATGNDGNGFIADTSANGVVFRDNTIRDCSGNGIALTKTNGNVVTGNVVERCKRGVNAGTTTGNTVSGNTGQA